MDSVRLIHSGDRIIVASRRDAVKVTSSPVILAPGTFEGPYELTPTLTGFEVETFRKLMEDDLTVNPIPINEAENAQRGYTVVIG